MFKVFIHNREGEEIKKKDLKEKYKQIWDKDNHLSCLQKLNSNTRTGFPVRKYPSLNCSPLNKMISFFYLFFVFS